MKGGGMTRVAVVMVLAISSLLAGCNRPTNTQAQNEAQSSQSGSDTRSNVSSEPDHKDSLSPTDVAKVTIEEIDTVAVTGAVGHKAEITSLQDSLEIQSIVINRGNCGFSPELTSPASLKFGEKLTIFLGCDPLTLKLTTDKGVFEYSFGTT